MTLKSNSLGDRLNQFKETQQTLPQDNTSTPLLNILINIVSGAYFILKTVIFGTGINIIFQTGWNFWEAICIGAGTTMLLNYIYDIVHDK